LPLIDLLGREGTLCQRGIQPRVALTGSWHYRFAATRIGPDSTARTIAASASSASLAGTGNIAASPRHWPRRIATARPQQDASSARPRRLHVRYERAGRRTLFGRRAGGAKMTPDQIVEAQRLARGRKPR